MQTMDGFAQPGLNVKSGGWGYRFRESCAAGVFASVETKSADFQEKRDQFSSPELGPSFGTKNGRRRALHSVVL